MPPLLRTVALALTILGLLIIPRAPWFGWLDVGIGAAGLLCAALVTTSSGTRAALAEAGLALATLGVWILGLVFRVPAWAVWWTFVMSFGFIAAAASLVLRSSRS